MTSVIVHKGENYPPFLTDCLEQFFLFNKTVPLYVLADRDFTELQTLKKSHKNLHIVLTSSLIKGFNHRFFLTLNRLTKSTWRGGFWRYVVERFFEIEDFMTQFNVTDVLHFEYDNMIYVDFEYLSLAFVNINRIAVPADCDHKCIPSVVFIPHKDLIRRYNFFYNLHYTLFPTNDMVAFSAFRKKKKKYCTTLPVIPKEYADDKKTLFSAIGKKAKNNSDYYNFYDCFGGVFDAAAFGQFVGGIDSRNDEGEKNTKGFVNESAVYSAADFVITWEKNKNNMNVPNIQYKTSEQIPIFNLHIHSKNLKDFRSDRS